MEQNKLPKNIRQIGEKEDWIRVYMEDYVHTYIQRLRGLQESGISGGVLLGKKQRINGVMHLFIRGAAVVEDPFWRTPGQTPGQMQAESSVYFPGLEICGFFVSSRQNRSSEVELVRIFETHFSSEYQVLFNVRDQDEEVFSYSGHGLLKLAGYYIYYEKNEEMQSYIIRQESLRVLGKQHGEEEMGEFSQDMEMSGQNSIKAGKGGSSEKNGKAGRAGKSSRSGKGPFGVGRLEPAEEQGNSILHAAAQKDSGQGGPRGIKTDTGQSSSRKKKEARVDKKTADKKKIKKGDMIVRAVSIAGIFILAFLLFSDQIKFSKLNDDSETSSGLLSSIISESQAVPAGADSSYITGETDENAEASQAGDTSEANAAEVNGTEVNGAEGDSNDENDNKGGDSTQANATQGSGTEGDSTEANAAQGNDVKGDSGEGADAKGNGEGNSTEANATQENSDESKVSSSKAANSSYVFPLRYLVKKGDSLYSISEKYYGSTDMVDAICLENNITDPSALKYGTVLTLPAR